MSNEIKLLSTKLSPTELQEAEVAHKLLADAGISLPQAVALMIQNYKPNQKARTWINHSPVGAIGTRKIVRSTFEVMTPESARVLMHDVEANHMELVPYFALTLFGAVRPGVREAECAQFDAALRRGESPILDGGIVVSGKCGYTRLLPWTQPLRAWLAAYPLGRELLPGGANAAEAEIRRIRLKHNLGRNVLRHTGITGMALVLDSIVTTALACGTSETIIRWRDLAWTKEQALEFYSIAPKGSAASAV